MKIGPSSQIMKVRPWKLNHEKKPSLMVRLHGPWCKLDIKPKIGFKVRANSHMCGNLLPSRGGH